MSTSPECAFCAQAAREPVPNLFVEELGAAVGDRYVLHETDGFIVTPSIGALVPGYCLVLPTTHVRSIGHLPLQQLCRLEVLLDDVATRLARGFGGRVLYYEHGPVSVERPAGSCADHAHLHVVPVPDGVDLATRFRADFDAYPIAGLGALGRQVERNESYLLLGEHGGDVLLSDAGRVVSQHFRRVLAAQLGRHDEWDWVLHAHADHVWATIDQYPRTARTP